MVSRAVAGVVAVLAVLGAGCTEESEPAMTKAEYLDLGNEVCADGSDAMEDAAAEAVAVEPTPGAQTGSLRAEYLQLVRGQIQDLRNLEAPAGDEDELDELYDDAEDALIASLDGVPDAADPFAAVNLRLVDYGLTECAES